MGTLVQRAGTRSLYKLFRASTWSVVGWEWGVDSQDTREQEPVGVRAAPWSTWPARWAELRPADDIAVIIVTNAHSTGYEECAGDQCVMLSTARPHASAGGCVSCVTHRVVVTSNPRN